MAYIRWGDELPSGARSSSFVFGGPDGLVNMENGRVIPYQDIRDLFKAEPKPLPDIEINKELGQRLGLEGEELEIVCNRLFHERNQGEWDKPFEFEAK